jgi:ribosomal protein S6--L-glutamate ligase
MKLIILTTEPENFVPQELKKKAEEKGHDIKIINFDDCYIFASEEPFISYNGEKLLEADICIPRISENNIEYKVAIVDNLSNAGIKCLNTGNGILLASNKLNCQITLNKAGIKTPNSIMLNNYDQLDYAVKSLDRKFPIIIKTIYGTHGIGVMRVDSIESLRSIVQYLLKIDCKFILQEYLKHEESYRILMLNNEVIAAASRSVPENDFRTNAHQGSELKYYFPSEQEIELAKKCSEIVNLNFIAVDYIKNGEDLIVLEINCSPGYEALQKIVDFNISEKIIDICHKIIHGDNQIEKTEDDISKNNKTDTDKIENNEEEKTQQNDNYQEKNNLTDVDLENNSNNIIGTVTNIIIKNFNDEKPIEARIDTGATNSSINGKDIEIKDNTVKFTFGKYRYKFYLSRIAKIKTPDSETEERPVINVDVSINGNIIRNVEFNINERDHMKYDVILGRSVLDLANVLIDPKISNTNNVNFTIEK